MPYTNDPANVPSDEVRFLVGDTSLTSPDLSDEEVAYLLLDQNNNPLRAAARAAETLAAKYTKSAVERHVGPLSVIHSSRLLTKAQEFQLLAKSLWSQVVAMQVVPFAGGISINDKNQHISDSDRVTPAFSRTMMQERGMGNERDSSEERLSSPEIQP